MGLVFLYRHVSQLSHCLLSLLIVPSLPRPVVISLICTLMRSLQLLMCQQTQTRRDAMKSTVFTRGNEEKRLGDGRWGADLGVNDGPLCTCVIMSMWEPRGLSDIILPRKILILLNQKLPIMHLLFGKQIFEHTRKRCTAFENNCIIVCVLYFAGLCDSSASWCSSCWFIGALFWFSVLCVLVCVHSHETWRRGGAPPNKELAAFWERGKDFHFKIISHISNTTIGSFVPPHSAESPVSHRITVDGIALCNKPEFRRCLPAEYLHHSVEIKQLASPC